MSSVVRITNTAGVCAIGTTAQQVWAASRARIGRVKLSNVLDQKLQPIKMALLPEDALVELPPEADAAPLSARQRRMLRLALPALQSCAEGAGLAAVPLFLGMPEVPARGQYVSDGSWLRGLIHISGHQSIQRLARRSRLGEPLPSRRWQPGWSI